MGAAPDARWFDALEAAGARRGDGVDVFERLVAVHDTPGRHYHDFEHTQLVVDHILALHRPGDDWATAVLAAWFHDAVYDPTAPSPSNEGRSAVLAVEELTVLGVTHATVGAVARLVCLTAGHAPPPGDRAGALVCDADLSILGADGNVYDAYVDAVRREYAHVADDAWRAGRRSVLRRFLDRPLIYTTPEAQTAWEASARTNISRELETLA